MENTYITYFDDDYQIPTNESMSSYPTLTIQGLEQGAIVGIMNNYGSDSIVRIKEIQINELTARSTTVLYNYALIRTSGTSNGGITGGDEVIPISYDSSITLPSQIKAYTKPQSVVNSGLFRNEPLLTGLSYTTALLGIYGLRGSGSPISGNGGLNVNHIFQSGNIDTQPIIIREQEGISLIHNPSSDNVSNPFPLEITVHFSDGVNTFIINELVYLERGVEIFALSNGLGSGVTLYISRIEFRPIRTIDTLKSFSIMSCSSLYGGDILPVIPFDSINPELDSKVQIRSNCIILREGSDSQRSRNPKAGGDRLNLRRTSMPVFGKSPGLENAMPVLPISNKVFNIDKVNNSGEFVLREGEGIAILQRENCSGWGKYSFSVVFTIEDNGGAPVSGGEVSYVF